MMRGCNFQYDKKYLKNSLEVYLKYEAINNLWYYTFKLEFLNCLIKRQCRKTQHFSTEEENQKLYSMQLSCTSLKTVAK